MSGQARRCHTSTVTHNTHDEHDWPDPADPTLTHHCDGRVSADDLTTSAEWRRSPGLARLFDEPMDAYRRRLTGQAAPGSDR